MDAVFALVGPLGVLGVGAPDVLLVRSCTVVVTVLTGLGSFGRLGVGALCECGVGARPVIVLTGCREVTATGLVPVPVLTSTVVAPRANPLPARTSAVAVAAMVPPRCSNRLV